MTNDEFRESFFEAYAEHGESSTDEWFEAFFNRAFNDGDPVELEIEWESHADTKKVPEGVDSEKLLSFDDGDGISYWTLSSLSGSQGPFERRKEAIEALGYDPDEFPPESAEAEDEDIEVEDDEDAVPDFDDDADPDDSEAYDDEEE